MRGRLLAAVVVEVRRRVRRCGGRRSRDGHRRCGWRRGCACRRRRALGRWEAADQRPSTLPLRGRDWTTRWMVDFETGSRSPVLGVPCADGLQLLLGQRARELRGGEAALHVGELGEEVHGEHAGHGVLLSLRAAEVRHRRQLGVQRDRPGVAGRQCGAGGRRRRPARGLESSARAGLSAQRLRLVVGAVYGTPSSPDPPSPPPCMVPAKTSGSQNVSARSTRWPCASSLVGSWSARRGSTPGSQRSRHRVLFAPSQGAGTAAAASSRSTCRGERT